MIEAVRRKVLVRDFFTCQRCGRHNTLQIAHRIHKGKESCRHIQDYILENYGEELTKTFINDEILNHPDNLVTTCSLPCNSSYNIFYNPVERDKLICSIYEKIKTPF